MIDVHCHLEQKELYEKLDELIPDLKKKLKFVISSCAHIHDLEKTFKIYNKFKPFIRICIGLHPIYIKEIKEEDIKRVISFIKDNKKNILGIGEVGLDYYWIKETAFREKQKDLFLKFINLSKEIDLPLIIHSRDATEDVIKILKEENMQDFKVLFHLFQDKSFLQEVSINNWFVSIGPSILKSKNIKKIARDMPLSKIMLETDSPWFAQGEQKFGTPENVIVVAKKISEIKKINFEEVEKQTDLNVCEFFNLK